MVNFDKCNSAENISVNYTFCVKSRKSINKISLKNICIFLAKKLSYRLSVISSNHPDSIMFGCDLEVTTPGLPRVYSKLTNSRGPCPPPPPNILLNVITFAP